MEEASGFNGQAELSAYLSDYNPNLAENYLQENEEMEFAPDADNNVYFEISLV